jgi:hypothetical protein
MHHTFEAAFEAVSPLLTVLDEVSTDSYSLFFVGCYRFLAA